MAVTAAEIRAILTLQDQLSGQLGKVQGELQKLGASAGSAGNAARSAGPSWVSMSTAIAAGTIATNALMAASRGLATGIGGAVAAATSFESQMSAVKAVSGATAGEMAQLQGLALKLGADTSFSAKEAAKGIEELVKAGISISDVMSGAASASLSLAAAGAISVGDAAEIAANAMNQFGLQGKDLAGVADLIAGAANASAIDVGDFKFSLAAVGAVANTVGFSFKDTATAIALLGQAGIKGSDAGTSLKTMLLNLQPTTKEQIALFRQLGLITASGANAFFDASGKVKSMAEVAGTLQNALKGMTQQQKLATLETIFGSDAIRAAAVFANEGADGFNEMAAAMGKVTADEVAKERLNNLKGSVEQLTGSLETAAISAGLKFTPALKGIVDGATELVNTAMPGLEAFAEQASTELVAAGIQAADSWRTLQQVFGEGWEPSAQIDPLVNSVGQAALAAKDAGEKIQQFADFVEQAAQKAGDQGAWQALTNGLDNLQHTVEFAGDRFNELAATLDRVTAASGGAMRPVDALAAIIRGAALGFEYATTMLDGWIDSALSGINVAANFVTGLSLLGQATQQLARGDIPGMIASVEGAGSAFAAGITAAEDYRARGLERVGAQATVMGQLVGTSMSQVQASTETSMSAAATAAETSMAAIETSASTHAAAAVSAVSDQSGPAEAAGRSVGASIGSGLEGGISAYAGRLASVAAGIVQRAISAARAAVGGADDASEYDGERASGGPVSGGRTYLVGERGPELFTPLEDGSILTSGATAAILDGTSGGSTGRGAGGGGRAVHVHLEGAQIYGFTDFEGAVQRAVSRGLKRGQFGS